MKGATQIVQTPDFCVLQNIPAPPLLLSGEKSSSREGGWGESHPHVQLKAGEGARTDFVPLLCPKFFLCCCDYFMLEKKHNRATREKTGHGKTGYFHGNDYERKQHYINLEIQRSLVKSLLFLSVGELVLSLMSFIIVTIFLLMVVIWTLHPVNSVQFLLFLCALEASQCRT